MKVNIAIIGASKKAIPLIESILSLKTANILGIAESKKNAVGLKIAKENNILIYDDVKELLKQDNINAVVDTNSSEKKSKLLQEFATEKTAIICDSNALEKITNLVKETQEFQNILIELTKQKQKVRDLEAAHKLSRTYTEVIASSHRKLDDKVLELSLLNETLTTLSSSTFDSKLIGNFIFNLTRKKLHFDVLSLYLHGKDPDSITINSETKIPKTIRDQTVSKTVLEFNIYSDLKIDTKSIEAAEFHNLKQVSENTPKANSIKNFHTLPINVSNKPYGIICLGFSEKYKLNKNEERFFNILTGQLALYLETEQIKHDITADRNRLKSILKSISGAVLVIDDHNKILLVNPVLEEFLGIKKKEVIGKHYADCINQTEIKSLLSSIALHKGKMLSKDISINNPITGISRIVKANIAKARSKDGSLVGIVVVLVDVTKEKEVDKMKSEFISLTSHELRTPLASIKEAISLIHDGTSGSVNETQKGFLDIATRNIDRLARLINNLLDISRIESGKMKLYRTEVSINDIAEETIKTFQPLARDKKVKVQSDLAKRVKKLQVDRDKITQVISNLISNALKFTPENGKITISTSYHGKDKNYIQLSVSDTGIGIEKKYFSKLFKKFQQIDSSLTRKTSGTGLGLSISKQLIELHGGTIWLDSEVGKGSVFSFILPVNIEKEDINNRKKVLIIDDEIDICLGAQARLEANGFKVYFALTGNEGLETANKVNPDLILLDLMMPGMDGFEVCHKLKTDPETASTPVVVLTALDDDNSSKKAVGAGAEGYLVKPFDYESFLFALEFLK